MKALRISIFFLISILNCQAQSSWEKAIDKDGIRIHTRISKKKKLKEFKAQMDIDARMSTVAAILTNAPNYHNWVYKLRSANVLKGKAPHGSWSHYTVNMPWPLSDRDGISMTSVKQASSNKLVITQISAPDYIPPKEGYVRLVQVDTSWTLERRESGKLRITYQSLADPQGLPTWLVNIFLLDGPMETLKALREEVKKPMFSQIELDWVKE